MENQANKPTSWEQAKAAIIAIMVGAAVSIVAELAQAAIHWLNGVDASVPGVVVGIGKYISKWRTIWHV